MSLGLSAPAAFPVEIRADDRRVFRLCRSIGEGGIELERPAPFEPGRPVLISFGLPGQAADRLSLRAELAVMGTKDEEGGECGGTGLFFIEPPAEARSAIGRYVLPRLGLPAPP